VVLLFKHCIDRSSGGLRGREVVMTRSDVVKDYSVLGPRDYARADDSNHSMALHALSRRTNGVQDQQ
jgi:hypothetical protein